MPCFDLIDSNFARAIAQFNQGDYYTCHDQLETLWMGADTVEKPFFQGILQIAVGFYHLGNHNWRGAAILLGEGVNRLRPFAPCHQQIDLDSLIDCGWAWLQALQQTGPGAIAAIAEALTQALGQSDQSLIGQGSYLDLTVNELRLALPVPRLVALVDPL